MRRSPLLVGVLLGLGLVLLAPDPALAWGPGTHVYIGLEILGSLGALSAPVGALLARHPLEFLYGSVAADIPMGKSYIPSDRHPHTWPVARRMYRRAGEDPALRAAALGYMSHLAADVVAHESFVPRMLLLTSSTRALGHSYWELRMDAGVGPRHAQLARSLVTAYDHRRIDRLLNDVVAGGFFSFETNRRIFRGMVRIADDQRWQSLFDTVVENSRWDLEREEIDVYLRAAYEHTLGYLMRREASPAAAGDPTGGEALQRSKRIRRQILLEEGWSTGGSLRRAADRFFPLPDAGDEASGERGGTRPVAQDAEARLLTPARRRRAS